MPFEFRKTEIPDVVLILPKVFMDERGYFMESYRKDIFENAGIKGEFIQENHSKSRYGTLRGLHFQKNPYAQAKIVRCIRGVIYDVAVDLRKGSPYFGRHVSVILSEYNKYVVYIPRGFAHGFLALTDDAEVVYKVDNVYSPTHEYGLIWNDPDLAIPWPIDKPILSQKDRKWPTLKELLKKGVVF